jgi:hypothetical protein
MFFGNSAKEMSRAQCSEWVYIFVKDLLYEVLTLIFIRFINCLSIKNNENSAYYVK